MFLPEVRNGTTFNITLEDDTMLEAEYLGNVDHMNFCIRSMDIMKKIDDYVGKIFPIKFFASAGDFAFTAEVKGINTKIGRNDAVDLIIKSPFKEIPRRAEVRITMSVKVRVYHYIDDAKTMFIGETICEGMSDDLSRSGMRLWCDTELTKPLDSMYTLEFMIPHGSTFILPAKLKRNKSDAAVRAYNYEYGFLFDFSKLPDRKDKLVLDILQARMKG